MKAAKTILEPQQELRVAYEADVVVVGGGPGGIGAAVAAAKSGAKTVLIERYNYLGGMGTGGMVTMFPHVSGGSDVLMPGGLMSEIIQRLDAVDGAFHPPMEVLGSDDPKDVAHWRSQGPWFVSDEGRVRMTLYHDPELLKCIYLDMVTDAGIKLFLNSWGTRALVQDDKVYGLVFESKSGRQAILAKVVIDATGDADLLPSAGAESTKKMDFHLRIRNVALSFHIAGVDADKLQAWADSDPDALDRISRGAFENNCFTVPPATMISRARDGKLWVNNFIPGMNQPLVDSSNVEDLTSCSVYAHKRMMRTLMYYRENCPGFEKAYIRIAAPQLGIRGGRRLVGEYTLVEQDMHTGREFEDTIVAAPHLEHDVSEKFPLRNIPYRCLVPKKVNGLLVAGRSYSSQDRVNEMVNLMPHCLGIGQAAGTAAAMAVREGIEVRDVNYAKLRAALREQGIYLPLNESEKAAAAAKPSKKEEKKD